MKESFLQFIWENNLYERENIQSDTFDVVEIINSGFRNKDAGPDFFNAKIKIGGQLWAGNVEIHVKSSDWYKHGHHKNKAYNNVILHVVNENDQQIQRDSGEIIPTISIKYNKKYFENYIDLMQENKKIVCSEKISKVESFILKHWQGKLLIERLEQKSILIEQLLEQNNNHWEETFYQYLSKNFGFNKNAVPFELLSKSLPVKYLSKHKNNLFQIEAMLFGQAGFLEDDFLDTYFQSLKSEYSFLQKKYEFKPIKKHLWIFLRLRPINFPTVRLAQFARLIEQSSKLFSEILANKNIKEIQALFEVTASNYWDTHYNFGKESVYKPKKLGKSSIDNILINTVSVFLFVYGKLKANEEYKNRAIELLQNISAENNSIIQNWKSAGIDVNNAFYSQSLIQLNNEYCQKNRCLECEIGSKIIKISV